MGLMTSVKVSHLFKETTKDIGKTIDELANVIGALLTQYLTRTRYSSSLVATWP